MKEYLVPLVVRPVLTVRARNIREAHRIAKTICGDGEGIAFAPVQRLASNAAQRCGASVESAKAVRPFGLNYIDLKKRRNWLV
jgi:hypothetical protein